MAPEVELFDDLDAVERDAAGALDRAAQASLFDRLDWFRLIETHCPPAGKPLVLRAKAGDSRAWLFLSAARGRAEPLASWYSLRFGAIFHGANEEGALLTAMARALRRHGLSDVALSPLAETKAWSGALREAGWLVRAEPSSVSWRLATFGIGFAAYWAGRPARLRNTAQRKLKAGLDLTVHTHFDPAAWADYERVYRASWKPAEGSPAFLRALAEQEGQAGTLRLGIARKDGEPVAAQLWLTENGTATIHKLAYAEDAKSLSPGTLLSMAMFRHALDVDHVHAIDFGLGDDSYKAEWMAGKAPVHLVHAYNPSNLRGLYRWARASASTLVRRARSR